MEIKRRYLCFLVFLLGMLMCNISKVSAFNSDRFGGKDRYYTGVEISQKNWSNSEYAIVASGENFPDALCATPLAKKYNAPILLTERNRLTPVTEQELRRLGVKHVFLIGGEGVVYKSVENQLKNIANDCTRIYGQDRYETSVKIAEKIGTYNKIVLASGENFPDAISIASIAAYRGMPIILTPMDSLPSVTKDYIENKNFTNVYIAGGPGVISKNVEKNFSNVKRLYGSNRYETNIEIIREFCAQDTLKTTYVASGKNFPDALTGSALASRTQSPIILIDNNGDLSAPREYVDRNREAISNLKILGGSGVITSAAISNLMSPKPKPKPEPQEIKICLDPGHGGIDSGAVGPSKTREKDVVLPVALKVGELLKQNGINVVYTRTDDNVSWSDGSAEDLQHRCDVAANANADYFVSIHANSAESPLAEGTETFHFSSSVEGNKLAKAIQEELVKEIKLNNRGVKTANYYVLRNTDCPATLVELAFINNSTEEQLLNNSQFQQKCAQGITKGILKFLNNK